jgi:DNA-binding response OmpR family regulator
MMTAVMPERTAAAESHLTADAVRARPLALLVSEGDADEGLRARLAEAGYEVEGAGPGAAAGAARALAPAFVLLAFGARGEEGSLVSLARRLRAEPATFALPVVFLFREDARALRSAAQHFGADDYFSLEATADELRARLAALLWRIGAGRRAAPLVAEQRSEIDNFILLLDAVGQDARAGATGAVALVEAATAAGAEADGQTLAAAHGFLKLNLRRVDAVAFYGPATLLVYLPRASAAAARNLLAGLREEFLSVHPWADLRAGLAAFPADGVEVERLVEKAEAALAETRAENSTARVVVYGEEKTFAAAPPTSGATPHEPDRRAPMAPEAGAAAAPPKMLTRDELEGTREPAAAQTSEPPTRRPRPRRLMLIVSDASRMAQVNLLLRSAGYEARAAFDGQHALGLLRIDRPDLLLVDYELQGMDGVEMLRRLRKQSGRAQPPPAVVLLPGGREDLRREALDAGARAAVQLPYDPVELLEALDGVGETL